MTNNEIELADFEKLKSKESRKKKTVNSRHWTKIPHRTKVTNFFGGDEMSDEMSTFFLSDKDNHSFRFTLTNYTESNA